MAIDFEMKGIFPCPVYITERGLDLDSTEEKEIEDIIKNGLYKVDAGAGKSNHPPSMDYYSENTYIFDTSLKNLKEFCEHHIKNYVKEILNPKTELDVYITQSWLNVVEPAGGINSHWHTNSIISGTFYISAEKDDTISFNDPNSRVNFMQFEPNEYNRWNSSVFSFPAINNRLLLFPSWLEHRVKPNEKATTDRISLAFNTFAKGFFGHKNEVNNLILK